MLKSNICTAIICSMSIPWASPLREAAPSFINRSAFSLAFANPPERAVSKSSNVNGVKSPQSLNYRSASYEEDIYTDRLWHSALVADSIRLELLQPDEPVSCTTSKDNASNEGLIETAKAFIPVAIEIGAVAALAAAANPLN
ncbi:hypothetical protein ACHAXN_000074 [Cyclotella atomus]